MGNFIDVVKDVSEKTDIRAAACAVFGDYVIEYEWCSGIGGILQGCEHRVGASGNGSGSC